jgi:hypothetical protein
MNNYYFLDIKTYWFLFQSWKVNKSLYWIHSYDFFNFIKNKDLKNVFYDTDDWLKLFVMH